MLEQVFQIAFAAGIVLAAAALAAGALDYLGRIILAAAAGLLAAAALAAWIAFALEPGNVLALTAAGLTACVLVALAAIQRAVSRSRRFERELEDVEERLREVVDRMTTDAAAEIEHVATRARAESVSLLAEEERRIGEERRREVVERERAAHAELTDTLAAIQRRVESRLAGWAEDLDRTQQNLVLQLDRLAERQKQLIVEAEAPSVARWWQDDLTAFTRHADYIATGGRRASVDSPRRAALVLDDWEGAQARFEAAQVLEDDYALLAAISQGQAIVGDVISVDTTNRELGPSGKSMTARIENTDGERIAPATPCRKRPTTSIVSEVAKPQSSENATNRSRPSMKKRRRPSRSPARPPSSSSPPKVSA